MSPDFGAINPFRASRAKQPAPIKPDGLIGAFESATQAAMDGVQPGRDGMVIKILAGLLALTVLLMAVIKVDRVVVSTGKVLAAGGPLFVQLLDRSIVGRVLVRTGDTVRKGQPLATLDPTFAAADLAQLRQKRESLTAQVERLRAEQEGRPLVAQTGNQYQLLQYSLWQQRRREYAQSLQDFDARIASGGSLIQRSRQDAANYEQKVKLSGEVEQMLTKLLERGYGSRLLQIAASRDRVEAERQVNESRNQVNQTQYDMASTSAQKLAFISKWQNDLVQELVRAENELDEVNQYLSKAEKQKDLTVLTAPEDAVVLEVGDLSKGSVVTGMDTKPLFTLVALRGATEAEVQIPAENIGFVRRGDKARVKLDAYRFMQHGTAEAVVQTLSEGSFATDADGKPTKPYFKARIKFTNTKLRNVPEEFRLVPGMTLQADMLVGHRTILSYLISGAIQTGSEAMREPQ